MPTAKPNYQPTTLPTGPPPYSPAVAQLAPATAEAEAVAGDTASYALSDAAYNAKYPQLVSAQQTSLDQINNGISGNINPQLANLWTRAGLGSAVSSTGGWSLGTGTAGMGNVARNLGLDQLGYYQQMLNNLNTANEQYRPRTYGLSGPDLVGISAADLQAQNNAAQSAYAYQVQNNQFNTGIANQNAVAGANAQNATTGNIISGAGSALSLVAAAFV